MSLSQQVAKTITDTINKFISNISEKYNLDEQELKDLWGSEDFKKVKCSKKVENTNESNSEYSKMNKAELIEICKGKGIKVSGTKNELIERLLNGGCVSSKNDKSDKNVKITSSEPEIIKKLVSKLPTISISRNKFGNYEHSETSFVFNNKNKKVLGKQNHDGTISSLTKEDIDICNKYKFSYEIPENLDSNKNNADIDIDELEDKEDEDKNEDKDDDEFVEEEFEEEAEEEMDDDEMEEEEVEEEEEYYDDD
jgi:hypothetical protein